MALTVAFGALYLWVFVAVRRDRAQLSLHPPRSTAVTWLAALLVLGTLMCLTLGQVGTAAAVYCAVAAMMLFPFRIAATITLLIAGTVLVLGETVPGWDRALDLAFATCAAAVAIFGITSMMKRNIDLSAPTRRTPTCWSRTNAPASPVTSTTSSATP